MKITGKDIKPVREQVKYKILHKCRIQVWKRAHYRVWYQVWDHVASQVQDKVENQVSEQVLTQFS